MMRVFLYLFLAVIGITVLRMFIGVIMRGASDLLSGGNTRTPQAPDTPAVGELKRDPVCGTYVSAATSIKKTVGAEVIHFCSPACRDKYGAKV